MLRVPGVSSLVVAAFLALAACGSDDGSSTVTPKKSTGGETTIDITFKGDTVDPQGASLVEAGEPLTLHIVADRPGELHIHSSPEQELAYEAGTSDKTVTIDQPGVVGIESHTLDKLVAQLEVR